MNDTATLPSAKEQLVCPECESPCPARPLRRGEELRCGHCGARVKKFSAVRSLQPAWALSTAGLLFLVWANLDPVLTFSVAGNMQANLIVTGVSGLFNQGYGPVGALVFFSAIAAPALHLAAIWYVSGACCLGRRWPGAGRMHRFAEMLEPWNLVPIFAIGCVVAVVKLDMLGSVEWQSGALWILALSLCSLLTVRAFDPELVEQSLERWR